MKTTNNLQIASCPRITSNIPLTLLKRCIRLAYNANTKTEFYTKSLSVHNNFIDSLLLKKTKVTYENRKLSRSDNKPLLTLKKILKDLDIIGSYDSVTNNSKTFVPLHYYCCEKIVCGIDLQTIRETPIALENFYSSFPGKYRKTILILNVIEIYKYLKIPSCYWYSIASLFESLGLLFMSNYCIRQYSKLLIESTNDNYKINIVSSVAELSSKTLERSLGLSILSNLCQKIIDENKTEKEGLLFKFNLISGFLLKSVLVYMRNEEIYLFSDVIVILLKQLDFRTTSKIKNNCFKLLQRFLALMENFIVISTKNNNYICPRIKANLIKSLNILAKLTEIYTSNISEDVITWTKTTRFNLSFLIICAYDLNKGEFFDNRTEKLISNTFELLNSSKQELRESMLFKYPELISRFIQKMERIADFKISVNLLQTLMDGEFDFQVTKNLDDILIKAYQKRFDKTKGKWSYDPNMGTFVCNSAVNDKNFSKNTSIKEVFCINKKNPINDTTETKNNISSYPRFHFINYKSPKKRKIFECSPVKNKRLVIGDELCQSIIKL